MFYLYLSIFIFIPSNIFAQSQHVKDTLVQNQVEIPLKQALGDEAYFEAMNSEIYTYVGNSKCRFCHRDFFVGRKNDLHDFTMHKLIKGKNDKNPRCLVCHSTGYGVDTGFVNIETTPRLSNVQCEGCHGPGSLHVELQKQKLRIGSKKKVSSLLVGNNHPNRLKKMCVSCHTGRWNNSYHNLQEAYDNYKYADPNKRYK